MKQTLSGIALSACMAWLLVVSAHAEPEPKLPARTDLSTLNCVSVFNMKRIETVMVLAWLQRHYAPAAGAPVLDQEKLFGDAVKLHSFCESHPDKTVMQAADLLFGGQ